MAPIETPKLAGKVTEKEKKMSLGEEMALMRAKLKGPTDAELIERAKWMLTHPETSRDLKEILGALLRASGQGLEIQ